MLWPRPKPEEYPGGGDWHSPARKDLARKSAYKTYRHKIMRRFVGTRAERFVKGCVRAAPSGRFLDIGCGDGKILKLARPFYDECAGLEPSPRAAAAARAAGFRVIERGLEDAALEDSHYDIIAMDSVIEHLADPVEALRICRRALKPGGIVALLTPKLGGPASRVHGRGWNGYRHGWHFFLFSGKTLGGCLEKAGFSVLARPKRDRPLDDILILWGRKTE